MFEIFFANFSKQQISRIFFDSSFKGELLKFQWFHFYTARLSKKPIHFAPKVQKPLLKSIAKTKRKTNEF